MCSIDYSFKIRKEKEKESRKGSIPTRNPMVLLWDNLKHVHTHTQVCWCLKIRGGPAYREAQECVLGRRTSLQDPLAENWPQRITCSRSPSCRADPVNIQYRRGRKKHSGSHLNTALRLPYRARILSQWDGKYSEGNKGACCIFSHSETWSLESMSSLWISGSSLAKGMLCSHSVSLPPPGSRASRIWALKPPMMRALPDLTICSWVSRFETQIVLFL